MAMRITQEHVGLTLFVGGDPPQDVKVVDCVDLTDDLPGGRTRSGSFFLGFTDGGDPGIQIIYSDSSQGQFRRASEYHSGVSLSRRGTPVFSEDLLFTLKLFGLSREHFIFLVGQAFGTVMKARAERA